MPKVPGLIKGLGVTFGEMVTTLKDGPQTTQYPHEKEEPAPRARGVITLKEDNCTACMLCARECPDWCLYIESHTETQPADEEHRRPRSVAVLDRFAIDFSLCLYCGICVEVCPFDALHWSPAYSYAAPTITELTHERADLDESRPDR
jgi:NADH-quinone oxidoreductase subunit I